MIIECNIIKKVLLNLAQSSLNLKVLNHQFMNNQDLIIIFNLFNKLIKLAY